MSPSPAVPPDAWVLVVVVNYRTPELTTACLAALAGEVARRPGTRVAVIDSRSGDASVPHLREAIRRGGWGAWASVLALTHNGGYAYANNVAIRQALLGPNPPEYVWLLNPDTVVREGALAGLAGYLEAHPQVGIAGSRLEDPDGTVQRSAFRFPSLWSELDAAARLGMVSRWLRHWVLAPPPPPGPETVDWVAGASMMIRREVLERLGLLDEGYFLYFEEVDFCLAARRAGWKCAYVPESRVVHLVGEASGVTKRRADPPRRPGYWFESRRRYLVKNLGPAQALLADFFRVVGLAAWQVRRALQRRPRIDPPRFLWDLVRHSVWCKGFRV